MLRAALASIPWLMPTSLPPATAPVAAPAAREETARVNSLPELIPEPLDTSSEAVLGWLKFMAAGYRGAADHLGNGNAADAELALGDVIEKTARAALEAQVGKKGKVKLNDAADGPITKVDDSGVTATIQKTETLVTWGEIDPKQIGLLISKAKPTAENEIVAAAALKLLSGDGVDAKQRAGKLTSELGTKLGELLEDMKTVGPVLKSARALDGALREADPVKAVEKFKAVWPEAKVTGLATDAAKALRAQFVLRATEASGGQKALAAAFHAKVTTNPSKLHPDAGPGGVGLTLEYDFEKDAEGRDFDVALLPKGVLGMAKGGGGATPTPTPPLVSQSRLLQDGDSLAAGALPIEFCADVEIELQGGLAEMIAGSQLGFVLVGLATADGKDRIITQNYAAIDCSIAGGAGPSWEKKIEPLGRGMQWATTLRMANGKLTYARLPETSPALNFAPSGPMRLFLLLGGPPTWFIERMVVKGTATGESMAKLAGLVAEREAKALFGE
ncbi:MAG: hypothetical protein FJ293_03595 [Planctomycetes bacterium]|nr:hypothetical protein [Planctomycetota bacterium]